MKLLWFLWTIFYVIHQEHLATSIATDSFTDIQRSLVDDFCWSMISTFKELNSPRYSLEDDNLPHVQNRVDNNGDESLDGNLILYNVVINGLNDNEGDNVDTVLHEREIHMAVKFKKLKVHGEFVIETFTEGTEEKRPFSVTFTNVRIEAVAYLVHSNYGQMEVTKVIPSIKCEESQISVKSKPAPHGQIMQLVLTHVQNNVEKRFARVAVLEAVNAGYFQEYDDDTSLNAVLFEARRFVSQRYDPYTIRISNEGEEMLSSWHLGPIHLHGLSNFDLNEITTSVPTNNSVTIYLQIAARDMYGNFSFFLREPWVGTLSIGKIEFITKITLMAENPQAVPELSGLAMEMTDCKCRIRNKVTGMAPDMQLGDDPESWFCVFIHHHISTEIMEKEIQREILNQVPIWLLKNKISHVVYEE